MRLTTEKRLRKIFVRDGETGSDEEVFDGVRETLPGDKLPLPQDLRVLNLSESKFHEEFMNQITYEDLKKVLPRLQKLTREPVPHWLVESDQYRFFTILQNTRHKKLKKLQLS